MKFRHGLLAIAITILIATGIGLGATLVGNQATQAHGPDRNNGDHPNHHRGTTYNAGSRCVKTIWADYPYDGYTHAAYTQGPRQGTYPVASVNATADWINEDLRWEVRIKWTAPRYGLESTTNKRWACQPHTYIIQRSLNGGAWTDFASSRRDPATVRSSRRTGIYGPNTAFSTDELTNDEPATRSAARYRVCGRLKAEKDDGVTYRSCVTSNTVYVGGPNWEPRITAENLSPIVMTEGQRHSVNIPVIAYPPPPAEFTSSALRSQQVEARFTRPDTQGVGCPTGSIDNQTQNVYFDADGNGTFTMQNPLSNDSVFTDDCQFKYSVGDHHSESTIYIKEDDQWPIAINATTDEINASDGTVTSSFEIEFTGTNDCPRLAGVKIPVTTSKSGRVEDDDFTVNSPITMGDRDCDAKTAVNINWEPEDETSTTSTSHGHLTALTKTSAAKNTYDQSSASIPSTSDTVTFTDTRTIIQFQSSSHSVPAQETVSIPLQPQCAAGTTGTQVDTPYKISTTGTNPTDETPEQALYYIPTANCFKSPIMYTPKRNLAGQQVTAELTGIPTGTTTTRILTSRKTSTIYVQADATTIIVSPSSVRLTEGRPGTSFAVRLSAEPTSDVNVRFQSGAKYTLTNADPAQDSDDTLTFTTTNWRSSQRITISAKHDQDEDDETGTTNIRASSSDPRYGGESVDINYTITDDDEIARLRLSSFARPILYPDSDGNTDETAGYDDDAYVKLSARFPARNTDPCYVEYISIAIKGTGLKTHFGHPLANPILDDFPFYVPYGDNPGRHWTVSQKSDYREYRATGWPGLIFHHYDDKTTDSEFIYHDTTPGSAKEGRIKSYAAGSATRCHGAYFTTHIVDLPTNGNSPTLDPTKNYGPYHRVNYAVE